MTIINPDHEAAIAAFHRAAARAGTGGDGRYARAVAFLEPSVRRDLEARTEPQAPSGDLVESPCPRCGKPVLSWTRIPDATAVCLHCTEIAPPGSTMDDTRRFDFLVSTYSRLVMRNGAWVVAVGGATPPESMERADPREAVDVAMAAHCGGDHG